MSRWQFVILVFIAMIASSEIGFSADPPLVESYLIEGKLADAKTALLARLQLETRDDQARFGLAVVQFLQAFENLGSNLYRYGLRTERSARGLFRAMNGVIPQNPNPDQISYENLREVLQLFLEQINASEKTLAAIKDPNVKLPLHVALIKFDPMGLGKPISAKIVLGQNQPQIPADKIDSLVVGFDRGDVCWLRGYLHVIAAWAELLLAIDGTEMFQTSGHIFFEKPVTPHTYLLDEPRDLESVQRFDTRTISDIIAYLHVMRFPIKAPERMKSSLQHLESTVAMSREMWTFYLKETDDEYEWIPNPKQSGVFLIKVTEPMIVTWNEVLDESERVLTGKKLLPFWRGAPSTKRGINFRRVFTEPKPLDPFFWFQGTAATSYLEEGEISQFADPKFAEKLDDVFGQNQFWNFAIWFN